MVGVGVSVGVGVTTVGVGVGLGVGVGEGLGRGTQHTDPWAHETVEASGSIVPSSQNRLILPIAGSTGTHDLGDTQVGFS